MRRRAFLALAAAAGCAPRRRLTARVLPERAEPAVELAVLGDSLAYGTGASDTAHGFAFLTYEAIARERPGSEITNYAIGGSVARDVVRLQAARLRERRADAVIVCVGGNDVVRATDPDAFAAAYRELLAAVRRFAPQAAIVVLGVPDVAISPLFAERAEAVRALARADDRGARAAASAARATYVDLFALTHGRRDPAAFLGSDRFHPSNGGHAAIAAAVIPAVRGALAKQGARRPVK